MQIGGFVCCGSGWCGMEIAKWVDRMAAARGCWEDRGFGRHGCSGGLGFKAFELVVDEGGEVRHFGRVLMVVMHVA